MLFKTNFLSKLGDNQLLNLFSRLGGAIKLAKVEKFVAESQNLPQAITEVLRVGSQKNLNFAISSFLDQKIDLAKTALSVKKELAAEKIKARFILPKEQDFLSSAQIYHHQLFKEGGEINLVGDGQKILLARTIAVQNPNDWAHRDFGIPAADAKSGMLPPKLARILVNLATGDWPLAASSQPLAASQLVYDPFCGNGRILLEAAYLGLDFFGSDIDPLKVEATKKNLRWLRDQYHLKITDEEIEKWVFVADARSVNYQMLGVNCQIITEPNLGPALRSLPNQKQVQTIADSLADLYVNSIKNLIRNKTTGLFVMPAWKTENNSIVFLRKKILDKLSAYGYYLEKLGEYARPNSFIIREIAKIACRN